MAKREVLDSDISGKPDAATVTFGLEGTWYEIDLTDDERKKLESALKGYLAKGREATPPKKRAVPTMTPEEREKIRDWGRTKSFNPPDFGRIPKDLQAAYDKAHKINRDESS